LSGHTGKMIFFTQIFRYMDQNWCRHRNMFGQYQDNFQLHRFTRRENTAKSFRGGLLFFDSHYRPILSTTKQQSSESGL